MKIHLLQHAASGKYFSGAEYWNIRLVDLSDPNVRVWTDHKDVKGQIWRWLRKITERVKREHLDILLGRQLNANDYPDEIIRYLPARKMTDEEYIEEVGKQFKHIIFELILPNAIEELGETLFPKSWRRIKL